MQDRFDLPSFALDSDRFAQRAAIVNGALRVLTQTLDADGYEAGETFTDLPGAPADYLRTVPMRPAGARFTRVTRAHGRGRGR